MKKTNPTETIDGLIILDKPSGITSLDVIRQLRRATEQKSFGHTGTLDPLATGMLPILCGQYTRYAQYIISQSKNYTAKIQLGSQTDTDDVDGIVTERSNIQVNDTDVSNILTQFHGIISQTPPIASAIRVEGKRLYEYHRSGTKPPYIPERKVTISAMKLLDFDKEKQIITCEITCSSGTYIRSIARDLGIKLQTFGHVLSLHRNWVSPFQQHKMASLEQIQSCQDLVKESAPITDAFTDQITIHDKDTLTQLAHGKTIETSYNNTDFAAILFQKRFFGLVSVINKKMKALRLLKNPLDCINEA